MKKDHSKIKALAMDAYFQFWVFRPNRESNAYWNNWIAQDPERSILIKEAREIVLALEFGEDAGVNCDLVQVWSKIQIDISVGRQRQHKYWQIAAVFLGILLLIPFYFLYNGNESRLLYASDYGEIKHITLPDNSRVILNGNTQLSFSKKDWGRSAKDRKVFLQGEAFFEVQHQEYQGKARKFVVHTNELDVEVLGTEFNVSSRHQETKVLLNSGKVSLSIPRDSSTSKVEMVPGDWVTFNKEEGNTKIAHLEQPGLLTSWRHNKLVFDGTTLEEITRILEDTYGLEIKFANDAQKEKQFKGTFLANDIYILKEALTQAYNIEIVESDAMD